MTRPTDLTEQDRGHLDDLLVSCPSLAILVEHVHRFADLLINRRGADLEDWMTAVEASDLPALHAFVRGLRKDLDPVVAGLSLPYSNGPIEGTNTKFKLLKRQMYGRAGFALLRSGSCSADPPAPPLLRQSRSSDTPAAARWARTGRPPRCRNSTSAGVSQVSGPRRVEVPARPPSRSPKRVRLSAGFVGSYPRVRPS